MSTLFWRDMAAVGTFVNLAASFGALMLAALGASGGLAAALHFAPLPFNLFLAMAVWRSPQRSVWSSSAALLWASVMTVV